ncbi:SH3 domain-containing protein [Nesterenkonia sandarakina]|nr:SH3 domain-containing protein [Nesterenkonia sandarakina]
MTANAAAADTAPMNVAPLPVVGVDAPATSLAGLGAVDISAAQNATQFRSPIAQRAYSYTSPYGPRCMPAVGASTWHLGQDLGAADGTPIASVADGTVVRTFTGNRYNASYVVVQHRVGGKTFHSAYYHMWNANTHVRIGQNVKAGQTIGLVGSSGPSTGPHLHLEIWEGAWINGTSHNPTTWLSQRGVNLRSGATTVLNITTPSSCNYWTLNSTPLRATASSAGAVIMQLGAGATLTASPGDMSNSMMRVNANGRTGWVAHSSLTPSRPAGGGTTVPAASVPEGTSITPTQYRTTTSLNARSGPGTNYAVLQGLASGTEVTVTATHGSWLKFSRNGQTVWSHSDFMSEVAAPAPAPTNVTPASGSYTVQPGGPLNVRTGPSSTSAIAKTLAPGTTVTVNGRQGSWLRFVDGSRTLWVHANYVNRVTTPAPAPTPSTGVTAASGTYQVQPGGRLNVRTGPSSTSAIAKTLAPGTTVTVNGRQGSWLRFVDGSRNLWVHANYVNKVDISTGSGSGSETISAASGSYQVQPGGRLNVRTGPSSTSAIAKTLAPGTTVTVNGRQGSWLRFVDGSRTLWVHANYVNRVTTPEPAPDTGVTAASGTYQVQPGGRLNVRTGPSSTSAIAKTLAAGTTVTVNGRQGSWLRFVDGSATLWVHANYVNLVTTPTPSTGSGVTAASGTYQVQPGGRLNVRTGPSSTSSVAKTLAAGTTVTVNGRQGSWLRFVDGSGTLWVHANYVNQVTTPAPSAGSGVTAASGTYQVQPGGRLNVRTGPSSTSSVAKTLAAGTTVTVNGRQGSWLRFVDGSGTLWVHANYVNLVTTPAPSAGSGVTAASGTYQVQPGGRLNVRTGPSSTSAVAKTLAAGTTVTVNGRQGSWLRFGDGSSTLWVHANYVNLVTTPAPSTGSGVTAASGSYRVQPGVNLNARTGPSSTSSIAKTLAPGTTVTVNGRQGSWLRFVDGSRTLWVHANYVTQVTTPAPSPASNAGVTAASGTYQVQPGGRLNVRTGPSSTSAVAKTLAAGTTVTVNGRQGSWLRFVDGSRNLWVHANYVNRVNVSTGSGSGSETIPGGPESSTSNTPTTIAASGTFQVQSGVSLHARTGASATSSSAKMLPAGTRISITGKRGDWVSFQDGSRTLWVHSGYLTKATTSAPAPASNTGVTAASGTYRVQPGGPLNVRTGPSSTSSIAKTLAPGTTVTVNGRQGSWLRFVDGSRTLWVHANYVNLVTAGSSGSTPSTGSSTGSSANTGSTSSSTKPATGTHHVKPGIYLNARGGPGTSHPIVLNLNPLRQFEITGRNGSWVSFVYSGKTVWVDSTYINSGPASSSSNTGSSSSTPTLANSTNSTSKVVGTAYATAQVNVRMGPSTENSPMFSVRTGTKVQLLEKKSNGWQEIKVNGATGWMSAQFLSTSAPATSGSGSNNTGSNTGSSGSGSSTAPSTSAMHKKSANGPYSSAWDKLAQCESGGNWKINTGNGFYGGIQFSPESWKEVGGSGFPHQATKAEQIKRAHMLWKKQGWKAWPHCTSQLGLKGDPGGYGDEYYKVHPSAKTASSASAAGTWTSTYSVPLREKAATSSDKLVQIPRGAELQQLQREGSWLKVQYTAGGDTHTGWVNTSYISQA